MGRGGGEVERERERERGREGGREGGRSDAEENLNLSRIPISKKLMLLVSPQRPYPSYILKPFILKEISLTYQAVHVKLKPELI